jgi:hypothetical protein
MFVFKLGIMLLSTCLPVGFDIVPPSALLWCLRPKQLRHNIHDVTFKRVKRSIDKTKCVVHDLSDQVVG